MGAKLAVGSPSGNGSRNAPIHQTIRNVAHALPDLRLGRRARGFGCADEIPVWLSPSTLQASLSICQEANTPARLRPRLFCSYKGMSHHSQPTNTSSHKPLSPQRTGFSQIHSRGGGEGGGQAMSVLLSWHEKCVEIAGVGSIVRVMTDRRTV